MWHVSGMLLLDWHVSRKSRSNFRNLLIGRVAGRWYRRHEAQKRYSFFFSSTTLAGAFGGLLAAAIGKMQGIQGYSGWRWVSMTDAMHTTRLTGGLDLHSGGAIDSCGLVHLLLPPSGLPRRSEMVVRRGTDLCYSSSSC